MKKVFLLIVTTSLVMCFLSFAQTQNTATQQIELKLVWEKEFDAPIANYIIDIDEVGEVMLRTIAFVADSAITIRFVNTEGKSTDVVQRLTSPSRGGVLRSKSGMYIGFYEIIRGSLGNVVEVDFSLYDRNGISMWEPSKINGGPVCLLDNGLLLCTENPFGWSDFVIWENGQMVSRFKPNDVEMSTGDFDVSENNYMIFNIYGDKGEVQIAQLVLYDGVGNEVWRKGFDWKWTGATAISDEGDYIVAVGQPSQLKLYMFSATGDLLWEQISANCEFMDFSPEGGYFVAGINLDNIHLFESATGKILWNHELPAEKSFFSIAVSRDGEYVVAADGVGRRENPGGDHSTIWLFDKEGSVVWMKELEIQDYRSPNVQFQKDGKHLLVTNMNKVYCYKIIGGSK